MKMVIHSKAVKLGVVLIAVLSPALSAFVTPAYAKQQLMLSERFGGDVNETKVNEGASAAERNVCTVASRDRCVDGVKGTEPGWFENPYSVAVNQSSHNVYVVEGNNNRVSELGPNGEFIGMFGWEVNETKDALTTATPAEKNLCTESEIESLAVKCKTGVAGAATGQIHGAVSIAIDQSTGNVFLADRFNFRVQEFTPSGRFILMLGANVNKTAVEKSGSEAERNICTETEIENAGVECEKAAKGTGNGAFATWPAGHGDLLAVGGPEDLLYVADEGRLQEFSASSGQWEKSTPILGRVNALTVDATGDVYVASSGEPGLHELDPTGNQVGEVDATSSTISAVALDPLGRIAIFDESLDRGYLYEQDGKVSAEWGAGVVSTGIAYDGGSGRLYAGAGLTPGQEILVFNLVVTPEVVTGEAKQIGSTTAILTGEVDAESSDAAMTATSLFEYGRCETIAGCPTSAYEASVVTVPPEELGESYQSVAREIAGLYPNQAYHYRLIASDQNGTSQGEEKSFETSPLPPAVTTAPEIPFVHNESAVLVGSLNPEKAVTTYAFEYGACPTPPQGCENCLELKICEETNVSAAASSGVYGDLSYTQEIAGLKSGKLYHVRLVAVNEHKEETRGPESSFTTALAPMPQAVTGSHSQPTATSVVVSGAVDPDREPAIYRFEIGVYDGSATVFGVVFSGSTGEGAAWEAEEQALTGLQPNTAYAYRISITSPYIKTTTHVLYGETMTFETEGLSAVLPALPVPLQLETPKAQFPTAGPSVRKCRRGFRLVKHEHCVRRNRKRAHKHRRHHR